MRVAMRVAIRLIFSKDALPVLNTKFTVIFVYITRKIWTCKIALYPFKLAPESKIVDFLAQLIPKSSFHRKNVTFSLVIVS